MGDRFCSLCDPYRRVFHPNEHPFGEKLLKWMLHVQRTGVAICALYCSRRNHVEMAESPKA